jgi:integrase
MLMPKRRHLKHCPQYGTSGTECPSKSKLKCPYIIEWYDEKGKRRQKSLKTPDWETAVKLVSKMVLSGDMEPAKLSKTVVAAIDDYFVEEKSRGIRDSTLKSFHKFLDGNPKRNPNGDYSPTLLQFAATHGIAYLKDFDPDLVGKFRQQWKVKGHAMKIQSERLKQFFGHAHAMGWIPTNPAAGLRAPKIDEDDNVPVVAFSPDEITRILKACGNNEYLRTFSLVMRYSGLATVDAVKLGPDRLEGSHLKLYRTKTGTWVKVLLPPVIVERLTALPVQAGGGWFWNRKGNESNHQTATGNIRRMLRPVFKEAKVYRKDKDGKTMLDDAGKPRHGHPYQWRHTFVNEQLIGGADFPRIAELLGDKPSTVQDTDAHFVTGRQKPLDETVKKSWDRDELEGFRL